MARRAWGAGAPQGGEEQPSRGADHAPSLKPLPFLQDRLRNTQPPWRLLRLQQASPVTDSLHLRLHRRSSGGTPSPALTGHQLEDGRLVAGGGRTHGTSLAEALPQALLRGLSQASSDCSFLRRQGQTPAWAPTPGNWESRPPAPRMPEPRPASPPDRPGHPAAGQAPQVQGCQWRRA